MFDIRLHYCPLSIASPNHTTLLRHALCYKFSVPRSKRRVAACPCPKQSCSVAHFCTFRESLRRRRLGCGPRASRIGWSSSATHRIQLDLYRKGASALQSAVEASEEALATRDIEFFARRLPKREFYRIAASFPESSVFLDIESTGLSPHYDQVTLVGWSVGSTYTVLVDPSQIAQLEHDLQEHPIVVTFNGSLFDLPFLTKRFETDWSGLCHVDLRYLAKRVGLTGGQKKIEQEIGLTREGSLSGITGAEAVSLWFDYKEGDLNALRELVRYNHADIEGMKFLFEEVIRRVVHPTVMLSSNSGLFPRSSIYFPHAESVSDGNAISISPYTGTVGPRLTYSELRENAPMLDDITIVGLDLTGSEKRKSGWAAVTGQNLNDGCRRIRCDLIKRTLDTEPFLVSIDSPLSLPAGRISEFDDDPGRGEFGIVREAERILRSQGRSCLSGAASQYAEAN